MHPYLTEDELIRITSVTSKVSFLRNVCSIRFISGGMSGMPIRFLALIFVLLDLGGNTLWVKSS